MYFPEPGLCAGHQPYDPRPDQTSTLENPLCGSLVLRADSATCCSHASNLPRKPLFYLCCIRLCQQSRSELGQFCPGLPMAACGMRHCELLLRYVFYALLENMSKNLGLLLFRLRRYRNQFNEVLRAANSGLSRSRFLRLFFLAFIMLLALTPIQAYMVYVQVKLSMPWHPFSWSLLHGPGSSWGVIERIPTGGAVYFDRWIPVASAYTAFAFFGTGRDASRMYRSFLRPFGLDCCFSPMENTTSGSFPHTSGSTGSRAHLIPGRGKAQ